MRAALRKKSQVNTPEKNVIDEERNRRKSSTNVPAHSRLQVPNTKHETGSSAVDKQPTGAAGYTQVYRQASLVRKSVPASVPTLVPASVPTLVPTSVPTSVPLEIIKQITVDVPRSRSPSPSLVPSTIPEEGGLEVKRVSRFRKVSSTDCPRSRSVSPVPARVPEQSALLASQATTTTTTTTTENNNGAPSQEEFHEPPQKEDPIAKAKRSAEKLRCIINELISTEQGYVQDLSTLTTRFLVPLKRAALIPDSEIDAITNTIKDISAFQDVLLQSMEEAKRLNPDFESLEHPDDFKRIVFALGSAFLFHRDTFNLYSKFCAVHSRAQKLINDPSKKGDEKMKSFLESRLSTDPDTPTLGIASYLIKPMQRILKYPLLLREMQGRFDSESETHYHLGSALKEMQTVANHINDMMRVHELYGDVFVSLLANTSMIKGAKKSKDIVTELPMDDLVMYSTSTWLNAEKDLGKTNRLKRGPEITVLVFRRAVVLICKEKVRTRRLSLGGMMAAAQAAADEGCSYKALIPIWNVQVKEDKEHEQSDGDYYQWELIHNTVTDLEENKKVFQLECSSAELRNEFVKTIRKMISERNRKQILQNAGRTSLVVKNLKEISKGAKSHRLGERGLRRWASTAQDSMCNNNENESPARSRPPAKKRENTF